MSRLFLTPLNLNQNELQNARLQNLATAPSTPAVGQVYYDTTQNSAMQWNGTAWVALDASKNTSVLNYRLSQFAAPNANIAMAGFTLTGLATPSASGQAATYDWVIGRPLSTFAVPLANIPMGGFTFTGLSTTPSAAGMAAEYSWVLSRSLSAFAAPTANLPMGGYKLTGLATPTVAGDAATYDWTLARPLSAFAAPAANIPMGNFKLTGLGAPSVAGDSAEYSWVIGQIQNAAAGIASKPPVNTVYTGNVATLSGLGTNDGYTPVAGDRLLLVGQTTASQNGVYIAASGAWTRSTVDGPAPGEIEPGAMWLVLNGTVNMATQWRVATTGTITIGTTPISIVQFNMPVTYAAGSGIAIASNTVSVNLTSGSGLAGSGLVVSGSGLAVDATVVARKYSTTIGDGTTTSFTVTHGLGTQDVLMQVRQAGTPFGEVECDMSATTTTTVTVAFGSAPASGAYRVTVIG